MSAPSLGPRPQPAQFQRVVDSLGSRRVWRRMAKRATAAHERELGEAARRLAASTPPVLLASSRPLRGAGQAAVVTLALSLPGWELVLSGVAATAAQTLETPALVPLQLTRTGRYGCFWWIEIARVAEGFEEHLVLLGSELRLTATGDGRGLLGPQRPALDLPAGAR